MKFLFSLLILTGIQAAAQTTGVLQNQKDAWDILYTYIGELKNGKANGMGIAKYPSGNVTRYVGSFANGMYNGKGTMLFGDGAFLTGNWVNGKLHGRGTNLSANGSIYFGEFKNGLKDGEGIYVFKDNSFVKGRYSNDKQNGRCINIWKDGKIISDVFYADDKRNGTGFQYESVTKKLYEGEWINDKWVQNAKAGFASFLQKTDFVGEATSSHVLMGPTGSGGLLQDTSYYYDLAKNKRYFGYYERGYLKSGIIVTDSTRFIGQLDDNGATGYCYNFKFGKYYSEGLFQKDLLNGDIVDISLSQKTVYYGAAKDGFFTGKAYFFSNSNNMYYGDFVQGKLTGEGYRLDNKGKFVKGTWSDGYVQKVSGIITANGKSIAGTQKVFSEALNLLVEDFITKFEICGGDIDQLETDYMGAEDVDVYFSLISVPGSVARDRVAIDFGNNNFYVSRFIETADFTRAKAKYEAIGKQLKTIVIRNAEIRTATQLEGSLIPAKESGVTQSAFTLKEAPRAYDQFHVLLELNRNESGQYTVLMKVGSQEE